MGEGGMDQSLKNWICVLCVFFFALLPILDPMIATAPTTQKQEDSDDSGITITVQKGQTLTSIAKEYLADPSRWREFLKYNNIPNPNLIKPGMKLVVPYYLSKEPLAKISFVMGKADYKRSDTTQDWKAVKIGLELYDQDFLKTYEKSQLELRMVDASLVKIYSNSILQLKKIISKQDKSDSTPEVFLRKGSLEAFISKLIIQKNQSNKLKIITPAALASVRGTQFHVGVTDEGNTTVSCFDGKVMVSAQGISIELNPGYATFVETGKPPNQPFKIPNQPQIQKP